MNYKTFYMIAGLLTFAGVGALDITQPDGDYYFVANETNTIKWKLESNDPKTISIKFISDKFAGAQSINASVATSDLSTEWTPLTGYVSDHVKLVFYNADTTATQGAEVPVATSDDFEIKPPGTAKPKPDTDDDHNDDKNGTGSKNNTSGEDSITPPTSRAIMVTVGAAIFAAVGALL